MGVIIHDAVIVTADGYVRDNRDPPGMPDVGAFRESLPEQWRPLVIGPVQSVINDYVTFAFLPDGSKEGWAASDRGDEYRARFAALFAFAYEDGSSPFEVVHIRYGADLEDAGPVARQVKSDALFIDME
jgi:hypothetical protein